MVSYVFCVPLVLESQGTPTLTRVSTAEPGDSNVYGFQYHFDIMAQAEVFGDNVVVDFEPVQCPGVATSDWYQCQCHHGG